MTKTFCDRCEKEIVAGIVIVQLSWSANCMAGSGYPNKVLCQPCFTALESFLNNK